MTECIHTLTCSTIFLICGSKPMSSMRSASSSTRYVQRRRLVFPASRKSSSRPGVAIQISAPVPQGKTTSRCQKTNFSMAVENPAFSQHQTKSMASLSESAATQACAHMHRCMYASTDKRKPESIIPPAPSTGCSRAEAQTVQRINH